MLFNSSSYIFFFIFVFVTNYILRDRKNIRLIFLLLVSYYFYLSWNGIYIVLIFVSTIIDYFISLKIEALSNQKYRKRLLFLSIFLNLLLLFTFKYYNFFIDSAFNFFNLIGLPFQYTTLQILLPVGISFYTFQSMSYTIDIYNKKIKPEKSLVRFALYIAFFPQLIAGPIIRPTDFLPQFRHKYSLSKKDFLFGVTLIWVGLLKKVVFADLFAVYADNYFNNMETISSFFTMLIGVYSFAFQIYFDFSGYTDVAIGSALLLGFKIPRNFNYPYFSLSFSDFWRRWHISLSTWLRDYLYIPLGGKYKKYRNILITFLLSGIWHGAALHFIFWGAYHAILLILEDYFRGKVEIHIPKLIRQLIVFNLICFGWIIFRVDDIADLQYLLYFSEFFNIEMLKYSDLLIPLMLLFFITMEFSSNKISLFNILINQNQYIQVLVHAIIFILIVVMGSFGQPFIYFRF